MCSEVRRRAPRGYGVDAYRPSRSSSRPAATSPSKALRRASVGMPVIAASSSTRLSEWAHRARTASSRCRLQPSLCSGPPAPRCGPRRADPGQDPLQRVVRDAGQVEGRPDLQRRPAGSAVGQGALGDPLPDHSSDRRPTFDAIGRSATTCRPTPALFRRVAATWPRTPKSQTRARFEDRPPAGVDGPPSGPRRAGSPSRAASLAADSGGPGDGPDGRSFEFGRSPRRARSMAGEESGRSMVPQRSNLRTDDGFFITLWFEEMDFEGVGEPLALDRVAFGGVAERHRLRAGRNRGGVVLEMSRSAPRRESPTVETGRRAPRGMTREVAPRAFGRPQAGNG